MSIREDVELYEKLSGEDGGNETIATIGAYLRGYSQGKEDAEPHWISCKKELPKLDSRCVLLYSNDNISGGYYRGNRTFDVDYGDEDVNTMVIVWMPLPGPYKGVTE